jgi:copper chaperone
MALVLHVQGMSCGHCVAAITSALAPLPGVTGVDVDLANGVVTVAGSPSEDAVAAAIEDSGYDVGPNAAATA